MSELPEVIKRVLVKLEEPYPSDGVVLDGADVKALIEAAERTSELEKKLNHLKGKRFPIQDGPNVRWSLMVPYEGQAQINHGQSLKRLAERGGLGVHEALCVVHSQEYRKSKFSKLTQDEAVKEWEAWIITAEKALQNERLANLETNNSRLTATSMNRARALESIAAVLRASEPSDAKSKLNSIRDILNTVKVA